MTTKTDKIYEIAETLGYDGPKGSRITDALDDLNSVVSGGGGGGGNVAIVNITADSAQGPYTADKTAAEIYDHLSAGEQVVGILVLSVQTGSGSLGPVTMTMNAVLACSMTTQKAEAGERTFDVTFSHVSVDAGGTTTLWLYKSSSSTGSNVSYGLTNKAIS